MVKTVFDKLLIDTESNYNYKLCNPKSTTEWNKYEYPKNLFLCAHPYFGDLLYTDKRGQTMIDILKDILGDTKLYVIELYFKDRLSYKDIKSKTGLGSERCRVILKKALRVLRLPSQVSIISDELSFNVNNSDTFLIDNLNLTTEGIQKLTSYGIYDTKSISKFTEVELSQLLRLSLKDIEVIKSNIELFKLEL